MTTATAPKATSTGARSADDAPVVMGNLWQRIASVQAEAGNIPKNGTAPREMGGFAFVRDVDVSDAARSLYSKHGIAYCPPQMVSMSYEQVGETERGKPLYRSLVCLRFTLRNVDAPEEVEQWDWWGIGDDLHDKGVSKAATSAVKTTLTKALLIGGGPSEDPDATDATKGEGRSSSRQSGELGGSTGRAPACPTCAELGIESKMWPAKKGPRVGELQCGGRDASGAYLNHYLPDAATPPTDAVRVTVTERAPVGRGCPQCDGDLEAITWSNGNQRIGCTNWRDKDGGCKYKEDVPKAGAVAVPAGDVDPSEIPF